MTSWSKALFKRYCTVNKFVIIKSLSKLNKFKMNQNERVKKKS